ncbi:DNA/RNA nuclease SfsA, partial [archaeon]|nr:DNA/RNA nuclease SfsA [archaeon]
VEMDPLFTNNIRKAVENGVEAYAYTCKITLEETNIEKSVPVNLEKQAIESEIA